MNVEALRSCGIPTFTEAIHVDAYRRDLWPRDTFAMYRHGTLPPAPTVVVTPRNASDVAHAIEWANREGIPVVPYGAGSGVCGGARGRQGSLVIDLKRMNRILSIHPATQTVHVESGILGQHLEDLLGKIGWMTAHSPSSIACSTTGGYIAARSAGQFSSRYGVFDDMLLAASAETPSGNLKAGLWTPNGEEDLLPILCGSEGGLGVVTDMLLRITPKPQQRWLRGFAFDNIEEAWSAMREIMQSGLWPSVLRLYDPVDTNIGGKTKAGDNKAGNGAFGWIRKTALNNPKLKHLLLNIPLSMPNLLNKIGGLLGNEVLLIVGFEGSLPVVNAASETAQTILQAGRDLGPEPGLHWFKHRHDVSYKLAPVFVGGAFADTMEVASTWAQLPALYRSVHGALAKNVAVMSHFSHAYPEGCSIYFSFAGKGDLNVYDRAWSSALAAARDAGGTVTHHHGVGTLKSVAAAKEAGAAIDVWYEIKNQYDPNGIMNPGRPFPELRPEVEEDTSIGPPEGGPVFEIDAVSLLAKVDPEAEPATLQMALKENGFQLQITPDKPWGDWLRALRRDAVDAWECPLVAIQVLTNDGIRTRISPAPRSAAGPDLRWSTMRRARVEWVQVPIRPLSSDTVIKGGHPHIERTDIRPRWHSENCWGFCSTQEHLSKLCVGEESDELEPSRSPEKTP